MLVEILPRKPRAGATAVPTRTFTLALTALLVATTARAQGAPAAPSRAPGIVPDAQKVQKADEYLARMRQDLKQVLARLEDARSEKDIVKLNCVNEKLAQVKGLLRVAEQADVALQESVARKDGGAEAEFQKISIAKVKVDQLRAEADQCVGQLAYAVDERTTVEVEAPAGLAPRDVTDREPPPPPVSRPPAASPSQP
jgi:hypothetical protein